MPGTWSLLVPNVERLDQPQLQEDQMVTLKIQQIP
jgi:hypothetical protein